MSAPKQVSYEEAIEAAAEIYLEAKLRIETEKAIAALHESAERAA